MASFLVDPAGPAFASRKNVYLMDVSCIRLIDEGHTVDLACLNFAKAFDSANCQFLLAKLKSSGIDGTPLSSNKCYLSDRSYQA